MLAASAIDLASAQTLRKKSSSILSFINHFLFIMDQKQGPSFQILESELL